MNSLHIASLLNQNPDVIDVLVKAGIPLEKKTENDYTALLIALGKNKNLEVAERLANLGANTQLYDENGHTAITIAENRVSRRGDKYVFISKEVNERILDAIR
jgi:ankyrin repeat protein